MNKSELQKKYDKLQKEYLDLWCEFMRVQMPSLSNLSNDEILKENRPVSMLFEKYKKAGD